MNRQSNICNVAPQFTARDNPFRTSRVESMIRFQPEWLGTTWPEILERFESFRQTRSRCAVVGPHGTGKTTFFDDFEQRLKQQGHDVLRLALHLTVDGQSDLPAVPTEVHSDTVVLLDSAGVVGWRFSNPLPFQQRKHWRTQLRRIAHCTIVETRHRRNSSPVLLQTDSTAAMLEAIIQRLDSEWEITSHEIEVLYRRHRGNIREALRECYDNRAAGH